MLSWVLPRLCNAGVNGDGAEGPLPLAGPSWCGENKANLGCVAGARQSSYHSTRALQGELCWAKSVQQGTSVHPHLPSLTPLLAHPQAGHHTGSPAASSQACCCQPKLSLSSHVVLFGKPGLQETAGQISSTCFTMPTRCFWPPQEEGWSCLGWGWWEDGEAAFPPRKLLEQEQVTESLQRSLYGLERGELQGEAPGQADQSGVHLCPRPVSSPGTSGLVPGGSTPQLCGMKTAPVAPQGLVPWGESFWRGEEQMPVGEAWGCSAVGWRELAEQTPEGCRLCFPSPPAPISCMALGPAAVPAPLLPSHGDGARAEHRPGSGSHGLTREAEEIESRALGCCHFTAPSS